MCSRHSSGSWGGYDRALASPTISASVITKGLIELESPIVDGDIGLVGINQKLGSTGSAHAPVSPQAASHRIARLCPVAFLDALDDPVADRPQTANILISDMAPAGESQECSTNGAKVSAFGFSYCLDPSVRILGNESRHHSHE